MSNDEQIDELVHSLAEDIADQFGGDLDAHPQIEIEAEAKQAIKKLLLEARKSELDNFVDDTNIQGYYLKVNGGNVSDRIDQLTKEVNSL